ncbi:uncharacterized protein LOC143203403 [Rhynchophorus ferrugineus]|uniref:uncharacterized protein LOC143203403 n=1 Tax=Rhynchophorus ferrugineus TaxID=354439 RepID=UPI003FCD06FA
MFWRSRNLSQSKSRSHFLVSYKEFLDKNKASCPLWRKLKLFHLTHVSRTPIKHATAIRATWIIIDAKESEDPTLPLVTSSRKHSWLLAQTHGLRSGMVKEKRVHSQEIFKMLFSTY